MRTQSVLRASFMAAAVTLATVQADAQRVASGTSANGLSWQAKSLIVGVTSTEPGSGGGNPLYFASQPKYSGVVSLIMRYSDGSAFICSGSLLPDRVSILTAGHCVSDGGGVKSPTLVSTTVYFPGTNPDAVEFATAPASRTRTVTTYTVHPNYTGEVVDQNDIAVLRMSSPAPVAAQAYGLFTGVKDLTGQNYNVAGYGARSTAGGSVGANSGVGILRQGDNRYDFRFGDSDFGGFFTNRDGNGDNFFGKAEIGFSFISDFDNGLVANDASCQLVGGPSFGGAKYCNLGRGATEVSTAGGDSGGPQFIDGMLSSVTSYGLTFGPDAGDIDCAEFDKLGNCTLGLLNSSFGEFNGFVPVYIHADFINSTLVPEPATFGLMAGGLFVLGVVARRRRNS